MAKPVDVKRDAKDEKRELTVDELNTVTGGGDNKAALVSNIEKKRSDTANSTIANLK
jgi:bacteriocin-like protein